MSCREVYGFMTDGECAILGDDVSLRFILDVKRDADLWSCRTGSSVRSDGISEVAELVHKKLAISEPIERCA